MKRTIVSAVLAFAVSGAVVAQQTAPAPSTPADATQSAQPGGHGHHHGPNPHREAAMLSHRLNLTPDQTAKLEPILADRDQKLSALHTDTSLAQDARRSQMRSIHLDTRQQFSNILTPEQMQKMQSMHRHHNGREQAPPTPSGL